MATIYMAIVCLLSVPQSKSLGPGEIERLIDIFLSNKQGKAAVAVQLLSQSPRSTREAVNSRLESLKKEKVKNRLRALRQRVLRKGLARIIQERVQTGLTYSGQWKDLKHYDPHVKKLLLKLILDDAVSFPIREAAMHAVSDLNFKELSDDLKKITQDVLNPDWLIEAAGITLAELGDRSWINRRIEALKEILEKNSGNVPRRYAATRLLSRYYYRLGEYKKAIEIYKQTKDILEARIETLDEDRAEILRRTLWLTYYNTACSACKGGMVGKAFSFLDKAIKAAPSRQVAKEIETNIQEDGDLKKLRKDPRYGKLRKRLQNIYTGKGDTEAGSNP